MINIAVAIMSFRRHEYLQKCLEALERNENIDRYDFIIFQDGAVNKFSGNRLARDEEIEMSIELTEDADLPNKEIRVNDHNLGIAIQRDKVLSLLEDDYDLLIQIENDLVLGRHGLNLLESMARQFNNHVCSIHRNERYNSINKPKEKLDKVIITDKLHWFSATMWSHTYEDIKSRWRKYMDICGDVEYGKRNRDRIFSAFPDAGVASSDAVCGSILREKRVWRVMPCVSRANYIGKNGVHVSPRTYDNKPYGEEGPADFNDDKHTREWKIESDNVEYR